MKKVIGLILSMIMLVAGAAFTTTFAFAYFNSKDQVS